MIGLRYWPLVLLACAPIHGATIVGAPREIAAPSGDMAGEPHLSTAPDGSVILSWLERKAPDSDTYALKFARRTRGTWSAPRVVIERDDLFVNWADFPSVVAGKDGVLFAHWLQKSGADPYAYDVRLAVSGDGGQTWSKSLTPHRDGTRTEHGFVSLVPRGDSVAAVWLDGRKMIGGHHDDEGSGDMTLRYALIGANGSISSEAELDSRTCECCQTGMAFTDLGPVVVYRGRSSEEVRDAWVVRKVKGTWSAPAPIRRDNWEIEGCPVNGPQIDTRGKTAAVAWFTAAKERNQVFASFSEDSGATFARAIAVDAGNPLGRVDIVLLPDRSAIVSWIEQAGKGAEVRARWVRADGSVEPPMRIGASSPARSAGVPRMTLAGNEVYLAWTEPSQPTRIRMAALPLSH